MTQPSNSSPEDIHNAAKPGAPINQSEQGGAPQPSGAHADNPGTAGPGPTHVHSTTPENALGHLNPSPEDSNTSPGTTTIK